MKCIDKVNGNVNFLNKYTFEKVLLDAKNSNGLSSCLIDSEGKVHIGISKQNDKGDFMANLYKMNRKLELVEIYKKGFIFNISINDVNILLNKFFLFLINQEKELYGFNTEYTPFYSTNNDIFGIDIKEKIGKQFKNKNKNKEIMFKKIKNIKDIPKAIFLLKIGGDIHSIQFKDEKNTDIDLSKIVVKTTI